MSLRPGSVTAVGVFYIIIGILSLLGLGTSVSGYSSSMDVIMLVINISFGLLLFIDGIVILQLKNWARILGIILAIYLLISAAFSAILVLTIPSGGFFAGAVMIATIIVLVVVAFFVFVGIFALVVLSQEDTKIAFE
ncbi:MAG: hypothetical protein ACTSRG_22270 [Candidatus Helarchaeota archaeon]